MIDYYKNYTSTSMLRGQDEPEMTAWSISYFNNVAAPHLPPNRLAAILDVGCGYGRYLKALDKIGYTNVYGIDISQEQIRYAHDVLGLQNCQVADALAFLEDKIEEYDVIMLFDVLEHLSLDDSIRLIRSAHIALRKEGALIIHVPNAISPLAVHRHWDLTHQRAYTTHSMEQALLLGGEWGIRHFGPLPFPPVGFIRIVRALIWYGMLRPLIYIYMIVVNGRMNQCIYTPNLITLARKCSTK